MCALESIGGRLVSHDAIINWIAGTTTRTGLTIHAELGHHPTGQGQREEPAAVNRKRADSQGDWSDALMLTRKKN